ncbi:uncharacterized protein RHOBADRAFT_14144, partial [Rhodotorula graminis WP1]
VRRSNREKIPRLDYWRNERIIYKRRSSGIGVNAIVRVPKEDPEPLGGAHGKKKGGAGGKRGASARAGSRGGTVKREVPEEQGVDDMTDPDGLVWSWEGDAEVSRRIAFTDKMMDPRPTFDKKFSYQKIYQELDYLAGGILTIPPNGEKALKPSKDNSYVRRLLPLFLSLSLARVDSTSLTSLHARRSSTASRAPSRSRSTAPSSRSARASPLSLSRPPSSSLLERIS